MSTVVHATEFSLEYSEFTLLEDGPVLMERAVCGAEYWVEKQGNNVYSSIGMVSGDVFWDVLDFLERPTQFKCPKCEEHPDLPFLLMRIV